MATSQKKKPFRCSVAALSVMDGNGISSKCFLFYFFKMAVPVIEFVKITW
jgi:hypothetical protein